MPPEVVDKGFSITIQKFSRSGAERDHRICGSGVLTIQSMVHVGSSFMLHLEECRGVLGYNSVSGMLFDSVYKNVRTISWKYLIFVVD